MKDFKYTRTPYDMFMEGWCDTCEDNYEECQN